jgi:hypothetical protein
VGHIEPVDLMAADIVEENLRFPAVQYADHLLDTQVWLIHVRATHCYNSSEAQAEYFLRIGVEMTRLHYIDMEGLKH